MFAAPVSFKRIAQEAAPDFYAVRALVVELAAVVPSGGVEREAMRLGAEYVSAPAVDVQAPDPEIALAEADVARRAGDRGREPLVRALVRAAEGLMARGRADDARDRALEAVAVGRSLATRDELLARALFVLAAADIAEGDAAGAIDHLEESLRLAREERGHPLRSRTGRLLDLLNALRLDVRAVEISRGFVATVDEWGDASKDAQLARAKGIALTWLAQGHVQAGDVASARRAAEQAVVTMRHALRMATDEPRATRELAVSLSVFGYAAFAGGDAKRGACGLCGISRTLPA